MKSPFFILFFTLIIFTNSPNVIANTTLEIYMNDFYSKSKQASQILREIENDLKDGSRIRVCSRQRKAAKLGLLANKSLIKAFELEGNKAPIKAIKFSQERWESILNEC